jgi:hypothetical protein
LVIDEAVVSNAIDATPVPLDRRLARPAIAAVDRDTVSEIASRFSRLNPAPFQYQAPATLLDAVALLVADPEAVLIAGGQSLMPVLDDASVLPRRDV